MDRANEARPLKTGSAPRLTITGAAQAEKGADTRLFLTVWAVGATHPMVGRLAVAEDIGPPVTVVEGPAVGRGRQDIGPTPTATLEAAVTETVTRALTGAETTGPER